MTKKEAAGMCITNLDQHYFFKVATITKGDDGSFYFIFDNKSNGAHLSFHPKEFHYRDNKETIIIPRNEIIDSSFEGLNSIQNLNYHQKPLIIELIKSIIDCYHFGECNVPNCQNKIGICINYNYFRYNLIEYLNKNQKLFHQVFGKPNVGLYKSNEEDENDEDSFDSIKDKWDIKPIPKCDYCEKLPMIFYKKGKYHFFECPKCHGMQMDYEFIQRYRVK